MTRKRELASLLLFHTFLRITSAGGDGGLLGITSVGGGVGIYWGQDGNEATLAEVCATGNYSYVNIGFLTIFGGGRTPELHCRLVNDGIHACQNRSIKVMLSIGGPDGNYSLSSREDARNLSVYLWNNFLGGDGGSGGIIRPLGDAVLDGIDLNLLFSVDDQAEYYADLVRFLKSYSNNERKVYISCAPRCMFPDFHLMAALNTSLLDYVWVRFFDDDACTYKSYNDVYLLDSWMLWTTSFNAGKIFLGLLAEPVDSRGFITERVLKEQILSKIQRSDKYGGLMLWTDSYTAVTNISSRTLPVPKTNGSRGNYQPSGYYGTAPVQSPGYPPSGYDGSNPRNSPSAVSLAWIIVGVVLGITSLVIVSTIMYYFLKSRSLPIVRYQETNQDVENFLLQHGSLVPKRYRYSEIKKITKSFSDKLGHGGFGSVYKGILPDGCLVAVKVLVEMNSNGEEFINEVASISRTSHVNIVNLLGFCFDRNKRALVYEFMPNKSLDKFISKNNSDCQVLDQKKMYEIAVGVAKGLEYLHSGCNTRIVHFDIKPQNILLDEDFHPKISDFGLAKLCKKKQSILSMLGTRGTIGYIAPEVFSRNFGQVSHKSDVYSFGMMILEMAGARNIEEDQTADSSENYFPDKIYEQVVLNPIESLDDPIVEEKGRKMFLVGFWCIQTTPLDRPPMSKVVEMLEGSIRSIQIPPKPVLFSHNTLSSLQENSPSLSEYVEPENTSEDIVEA